MTLQCEQDPCTWVIQCFIRFPNITAQVCRTCLSVRIQQLASLFNQCGECRIGQSDSDPALNTTLHEQCFGWAESFKENPTTWAALNGTSNDTRTTSPYHTPLEVISLALLFILFSLFFMSCCYYTRPNAPSPLNVFDQESSPPQPSDHSFSLPLSARSSRSFWKSRQKRPSRFASTCSIHSLASDITFVNVDTMK